MNQNAIPLKDRQQKKKHKNIIGLMKDKLGRKIMAKFVGLRVRTYAYLIDDSSEGKKAKG